MTMFLWDMERSFLERSLTKIAVALIFIGALFWLVAFFSESAAGHEWYTGQRNKQNEDCCGKSDCEEVPDSAVTEVPGGWRVVAALKRAGYEIDHVFAYSEKLPSPDKHWHVCAHRGTFNSVAFTCFFGPTPST